MEAGGEYAGIQWTRTPIALNVSNGELVDFQQIFVRTVTSKEDWGLYSIVLSTQGINISLHFTSVNISNCCGANGNMPWVSAYATSINSNSLDLTDHFSNTFISPTCVVAMAIPSSHMPYVMGPILPSMLPVYVSVAGAILIMAVGIAFAMILIIFRWRKKHKR